ncbi:hypothetical protein LDENG_00193480, partial [Lucifuga dentata]
LALGKTFWYNEGGGPAPSGHCTGQCCRFPLQTVSLNLVTCHTKETSVTSVTSLLLCTHLSHSEVLQSRLLSWQQIPSQYAGLVSFCS